MEKPTKKYAMLIAAAYRLFAVHGYEKTTVDEILKESGISKGLFYHHFANKKELFLFLYLQAAKEISEKTLAIFQGERMDLLIFAKEYMKMQFSLSQETPYLFLFLKRAEGENLLEIHGMMQHVLLHRHRWMMEQLDWNTLQEGVTKEQAISLVTWLAEGFTNEILEKEECFGEQTYQAFCVYLELIAKSIFVKKEHE